MEPGGMYPFEPRGACVFYKDELCSIHPVKPFECNYHDHTTDDEEQLKEREKVVAEWREHQDQIKSLLGTDKLEVPTPDLADMFNFLKMGLGL
jgi:Fe-S-cluster containining protein